MTPQEKQLLERFLADMGAAQPGQKDPEAEALIREAVSRQPDAAYLLVQRALQLDQVLQIREAEVQKLQAELTQAKSGNNAPTSGGFLGDPYAWGSRPSGTSQTASTSGSAPIPGVQSRPGTLAAQPQAAPQQPTRSAWGGSGMLGTVATTAAGVVAGSFLYQGIQNLMHRNDTPGGGAEHANSASADQHAQPLVADSAGFDELGPTDTEMDSFAGGGDDGDVA